MTVGPADWALALHVRAQTVASQALGQCGLLCRRPPAVSSIGGADIGLEYLCYDLLSLSSADL